MLKYVLFLFIVFTCAGRYTDKTYREATLESKWLTTSWNLVCNQPGLIIDTRFSGIFNDGTDIILFTSGFHVGGQGGEIGYIVDIGTFEDLKTKYPNHGEEFGGDWGEQQFVALGYNKDSTISNPITVAYSRNRDGEITKRIGLDEALPIINRTASDDAPVKVGHIYIMRILHPDTEEDLIIAKFFVKRFEENYQATIVYQVLYNGRPNEKCNRFTYSFPGYMSAMDIEKMNYSGITVAFVFAFIIAIIGVIIGSVGIILAIRNRRGYQL